MTSEVDWSEVRKQLDALYSASEALERLFPGRRFTLDGHLVGSIGEVIAAYMFGLDLSTASTKAHDAVAAGNKRVEIKFTQGAAVAIRHQPDHLVVLHRPRSGPVRVVFNGPGELAWNRAGSMAANGQRPIRLSRLSAMDKLVPDELRLPVLREAPV